MKLWGGRFRKETDSLVNDFNASIHFDCRMYREDIEGSMAHARMLGDCGIISREDAEAITQGLAGILADVEAGKIEFTADNALPSLHGDRLGQIPRLIHVAD